MKRILLVEDNEMNRDMLARRLRRSGYDVTLAPDGFAAIGEALSMPPDLILMDLDLPGLDGYEATRRIREALSGRRVPVIVVSAHALESEQARARDAGCDDFDAKPIDLPRLLEKIERALRSAA